MDAPSWLVEATLLGCPFPETDEALAALAALGVTVLVDCGALCACLTAATGRGPVVLGKPEPALLLDICRRAGVRPGEAAMVGDRLYTDIAMGRRAGVPAVLVLTGEATADEAADCPLPPDLVVADVGELGERLAAARAAEPPAGGAATPVAPRTP